MSINRIVWILSFCCFGGVPLAAQKPAELKKEGESAFSDGRWPAALDLLSRYQQAKPGDPAVLTKLAITYYQVHQADKARQLFEFLLQQNPQSRDADLLFYFARTLHGQQEYDRAMQTYKAFLRVCGDAHPLRDYVVSNIQRCVNAATVPQNDAIALVENLGDQINTAGDEFAPLPSVNHAERIYYAAAREGTLGGLRNDAGYEDAKTGHYCSDMFAADLLTSGWESAGDLGGLLNTSRFDVALDFDQSGQILYFFRGFTLYSGEIFADTAGRKDEYAVKTPMFTSPMQPEMGDAAPFFFNDSILIFASRRSGGQGGLDLYVTTRSKGLWSSPQNLGPTVNSAFDETNPFLANDGRTLYFSSNNLATLGGLDIFKTVFEAKKETWSPPVNLGTPVNSPGDDAYFRLSADGRTAFFASDRLESRGQRDIYIAYFKEAQPEQTAAVAVFYAVNKPVDTGKTAAATPEMLKITLPTLFYDNDRTVLAPDNLKTIDALAAAARNYPDATVLVAVHTDETGPSKFDLYNGIKRAEIIGKALTERGIASGRILLKSGGPGYPLARNVVDAAPNPVGQRLNRRIELALNNLESNLPVQVSLERPVISPLMQAAGAARFDAFQTGLYYKVETITTRQILNNDALGMFTDAMIETQPGADAYRYTVGLSQQFSVAAALRKEVAGQGFPDALVVAYINGIRVSRAEAVGLLKKYPDLAAFIKG